MQNKLAIDTPCPKIQLMVGFIPASCHNHSIKRPGCYLSFALQAVQCCRGQKPPIEFDWIYCLLAICSIKLASAIVLSQSS